MVVFIITQKNNLIKSKFLIDLKRINKKSHEFLSNRNTSVYFDLLRLHSVFVAFN